MIDWIDIELIYPLMKADIAFLLARIDHYDRHFDHHENAFDDTPEPPLLSERGGACSSFLGFCIHFPVLL